MLHSFSKLRIENGFDRQEKDTQGRSCCCILFCCLHQKGTQEGLGVLVADVVLVDQGWVNCHANATPSFDLECSGDIRIWEFTISWWMDHKFLKGRTSGQLTPEAHTMEVESPSCLMCIFTLLQSYLTVDVVQACDRHNNVGTFFDCHVAFEMGEGVRQGTVTFPEVVKMAIFYRKQRLWEMSAEWIPSLVEQ